MYPGKSKTETFTVSNAGVAPVNLTITDDQFVRFAEKTIDFTTVDQKLETANFRMPDYLIDIKQHDPGRHADDGSRPRPAVHGVRSERRLQRQLELAHRPDRLDRRERRWQALRGQERQRRDQLPDRRRQPELERATCEIQGGEYMRFGYGYDRGTTMQQRVKMPLERKHRRHLRRPAAIARSPRPYRSRT